jgi:hypothetical protein
MIRFHDIKNSLIAGFHGAQEAILDMADKISTKVQETKMLLEIKDLENEMNRSHSRLGGIFYQLRDQGIYAIHENPETHKILGQCKTLQEKISRLREKYHTISKSYLNSQVSFLGQELEKQNIKLIRLTIDKKSPLKGCKVRDLKLSQDILVLCVLKKNRLMIANGDTRIDDHDSIFVMGPEPQIDQLKEGNPANPQ